MVEEFSIANTSFIQPRLGELISDTLFCFPCKKGGFAYYHLVEHMRTPIKLMPLRTWDYCLQIIWDDLKRAKKERRKIKVPLVLTTVIYNGEKNYTTPTDLYGLIDAPKELVTKMLTGFDLMNLEKIPDEELQGDDPWASIFLTILKYGPRVEGIEKLAELKDDIKVVRGEFLGWPFVVTSVYYMFHTGSIKNPKGVIARLKEHLDDSEEKMTNIVSQLMDLGREEGYEKGLDKGYENGVEKTAYNLLANGCEPIFVAKNTGLTLDRCKEIRAKMKRDEQSQDP